MPRPGDPPPRSPYGQSRRPPPPPVTDSLLGGGGPTPPSSTVVPPAPPGLSTHQKTARNIVTSKLNTKSGRRLIRITFFIFSPIGIAGYLLGPFGGDGSQPAEPAQVAGAITSEPSQLAPVNDTSELIRSIVFIISYECERSGSGTIVNDGSHVLTNAHVVERPGSSCDLNVWFTPSDTEEAYTVNSAGYCIRRCEPDANAKVVAIDSELDLAVLELLDPTTDSTIDASRLGYPAVPLSTDKPGFREVLFVLGYPGSGGRTITTTEGIYSGLSKDWPPYEYYKTQTMINHGNSGGGAFTDDGRFIGIPTAGTLGELDCDIVEECVVGDLPYGLIRPSRYAVPLLQEALG